MDGVTLRLPASTGDGALNNLATKTGVLLYEDAGRPQHQARMAKLWLVLRWRVAQ